MDSVECLIASDRGRTSFVVGTIEFQRGRCWVTRRQGEYMDNKSVKRGLKGSRGPSGPALTSSAIHAIAKHSGNKFSHITSKLLAGAVSVDDIGEILRGEIPKVKSLKSDGCDEEYLCIGLGSKQFNGKHILFLDLDHTTKHQAELVAKSIISSIGCSDCYIVRSSLKAGKTSHHLVCFDMFFFGEVQKVAKEFGHDQWAKFRGEAKDFVLRIGPKMRVMMRENSGDIFLEEVEGTMPVLVSVVSSPFRYRPKSNSMRKIFSNVWGHHIQKDSMFTDSSLFRFHCYRVRLSRLNGDKVSKDVKFEHDKNLNKRLKEKLKQGD